MEAINRLQNDDKVTSIQVTSKEYFTKVQNSDGEAGLYSWGSPYKGYKNMKFKDWILTYVKSSDWVIIREGRWADIKNNSILDIVTAAVGLLVGGVSSSAGAVYTVAQLVVNLFPGSIPASSKVRYSVVFHMDEKVEKYTYVYEPSTDQYEYGALTERIKYYFQKSVNVPGHRVDTSEDTPTRTVTTQYFNNPDRKAWNATSNPWIERIGDIKYGGKYFSTN